MYGKGGDGNSEGTTSESTYGSGGEGRCIGDGGTIDTRARKGGDGIVVIRYQV